MNRIKLIAFDLDGTLLTTDKRLTDYTEAVLKRAADRGIEIVPATGRPLIGVPEIFFQFPWIHYVITSNGARTVRVKDKETIDEKPMSYESAKEILAVFKEYDTMRDIFYDGQGYTERQKFAEIHRYVLSPVMIQYVRTSRIPVESIDETFARENRPLDKLQALFADPAEKREAMERLQRMKGIEASGALGNNIEVNGEGVHKGAALLSLGERLQIHADEMVAFGDGTNDVKMLKTAGIGVAMANAVQEVKDAADALALSNDEEGVARYIEQYVLN